jgi:hypothetical protein
MPLSTARRRSVLAALVCALLAIVHTWPLVTNPATLCRNDNGDALLNEWILAWVAHQLPYAPARLFDANIFYPAKDTLAFSEPLIVPAILGMPVRWAGGSPVLMFNVVLLLGFALTAFAGYVLVREWTGDHAAGLLAGSLFAFNTHTLTRLAHVQGIHAWGLPLALLAADRVIVHARIRDALWLALWMAAMAYTSGYLVVFGAVLVGVLVAVRAGEWWPRARGVLAALAVASIAGGIGVLPLFFPYRRVAIEQGMVRTLDSVTGYSATLTGYLASAGRLHYKLWSQPLFEQPIDSFFPGVMALLLALAAVVWVVRGRELKPGDSPQLTRNRVWMLVAVAAAGLILSLGTQTPIYGWLFHVLPPMQGLRAASRFGNLFLLGIAALAGIGLAMLNSRLPAGRVGVVSVAVVALANLEALRAPFPYRHFEGIPAIYSLVAQAPGRVVLAEVPFYPASAVFENATYMLNSTAHFKPLMNGYSGYTPASYRQFAEMFHGFPDEPAIVAMRQAGVTHVLVHPARLNQDPEQTARTMERVNASPFLERIAIGQHGLTLYRMR